jgi:hypothetical protein
MILQKYRCGGLLNPRFARYLDRVYRNESSPGRLFMPKGSRKPEEEPEENGPTNLDCTPEIRPDKVQRARELLKDPNYPGPEILEEIGELLAAEWDNRPSRRKS